MIRLFKKMEQNITFCISIFFFIFATGATQECQAVNDTCGNGGTCYVNCIDSTTESPTTAVAADTTTTTTTPRPTPQPATPPPQPNTPVPALGRKRRAVADCSAHCSNEQQCEWKCSSSATSQKESLCMQMLLVGLLVWMFLIY